MNFSEVCKKFSATPRWQKRIALSLLLIFDAYLGLTHHKGMIAWSNFFVGDFVWILQSTEMMAGGLLVIHTMFNETS
ncbi:MAG TPA: hypothetical protein EYN17_03055, partial [Candidatus Poseidoniales archaeon]|nr:hypothetical protein [Candidatus Poseidoniales archaeon]